MQIKMDDYAYSSKLMRELPESKLLFGSIPLCVCLFANSFLASLLTIAVMAVLSIRSTAITPGRYGRLLLVPLGFLLVGTATILIAKYPAGHEMLVGIPLGGSLYGVDTKSLYAGMNLILRALAAVSCMYFISLNTPMGDLLAALHKIKVPLILISLMELIYRYIFVLLSEVQTMKTAQSSRLGYRNFKTAVKSTGELIGSLFLRTYLRCDRVYAALESRGYHGELKTLEKNYERHLCWGIFAILFGVILAGVAILERTVL